MVCEGRRLAWRKHASSSEPPDPGHATNSEGLFWTSKAFSLHSYHSILIPPTVNCCLSRKYRRGQACIHVQSPVTSSCCNGGPGAGACTHEAQMSRAHTPRKEIQAGCCGHGALRPGPVGPPPLLHGRLCVARCLKMLRTAVTAHPVPDDSVIPAHSSLLTLRSWPRCAEGKADVVGGGCNLPQPHSRSWGQQGLEPSLPAAPGLTTTTRSHGNLPACLGWASPTKESGPFCLPPPFLLGMWEEGCDGGPLAGYFQAV